MDKNPLHLLLHKQAGEVHTSKLVMKDLVILSVFFINLEDVTFLGHFIAGKIFIISCDFINQFAVRKNFHNTVCGCLYKLMIMRCEKDYTRKFDQSVVKCSWLRRSSSWKEGSELFHHRKEHGHVLHRLHPGKAYDQGIHGHKLRP